LSAPVAVAAAGYAMIVWCSGGKQCPEMGR